MLIKADASQLEWRVKVFLAQDPVGMKEINEGFPIHDDNKERFGLPTRTIAKIFLYRIIFSDAFGERGFSGPAYSYANDADFRGTSTKAKFWESVIERFFDKYKGVYQHSINLIQTAQSTGRIESPSGRFYLYSPVAKWNGETDWPRTQILNHIVQGLSADFVMCARLILKRRLEQISGYGKIILPINTIHDDIELDIDHTVDSGLEFCYNICNEMIKAFRDIPQRFEKVYGTKVNVPMDAEVSFGMTLYEPEMRVFDPKTFEKDFNECLKNR